MICCDVCHTTIPHSKIFFMKTSETIFKNEVSVLVELARLLIGDSCDLLDYPSCYTISLLEE